MNYQPGQFLAEPLVTDTLIYEIVKVTPKSVVVRRTKDGGKPIRDLKVDQSDYPVLWTPQVPDESRELRRLYIRANGSLRFGNGNKLRPAPEIDGQPVRRVDYRY